MVRENHEGKNEESDEQTEEGQRGKRDADFPDSRRPKIFLEIAAFALSADG